MFVCAPKFLALNGRRYTCARRCSSRALLLLSEHSPSPSALMSQALGRPSRRSCLSCRGANLCPIAPTRWGLNRSTSHLAPSDLLPIAQVLSLSLQLAELIFPDRLRKMETRARAVETAPRRIHPFQMMPARRGLRAPLCFLHLAAPIPRNHAGTSGARFRLG